MKITKHSIVLKCCCDSENCIEELRVTRWDDGTFTFFGFEADLNQDQVTELIAFLMEKKHDEVMTNGVSQS